MSERHMPINVAIGGGGGYVFEGLYEVNILGGASLCSCLYQTFSY